MGYAFVLAGAGSLRSLRRSGADGGDGASEVCASSKEESSKGQKVGETQEGGTKKGKVQQKSRSLGLRLDASVGGTCVSLRWWHDRGSVRALFPQERRSRRLLARLSAPRDVARHDMFSWLYSAANGARYRWDYYHV